MCTGQAFLDDEGVDSEIGVLVSCPDEDESVTNIKRPAVCYVFC